MDKVTKDSIVYQINPCRTCNSTEAVELLDINKVLYWVSCARCGKETRVYDNKKKAITAWNRRNSNG